MGSYVEKGVLPTRTLLNVFRKLVVLKGKRLSPLYIFDITSLSEYTQLL